MMKCYKIPFIEKDNIETAYNLINKDLNNLVDEKRNKKIIFYGNGEGKICKTLLTIASEKGFDITVVTSIFMFPSHLLMEKLEVNASKKKVALVATTSFEEALHNADIIYVEKEENIEKIEEYLAKRSS